MKYSLIMLCMVFMLACSKDDDDTPETPQKDIQLTRDLIAYFPFTGNTNDQSGNGNNGVLTNGSTLTYDENGRALSAINFAGSGQKLVVANNGKMKYDTALTVSFHVMTRNYTRSSMIGIIDNVTGKSQSLVIGTAQPNSSNLFYSVVNKDIGCTGVPTAAQVTNIDAGLSFQPEAWYHVLATYTKGAMKLYINGNQIGATTSSSTSLNFCQNAHLIIGGWWNSDPASINGKMDEVRLYSRVLNADEISELAKSFQPG